MYLLEKEKGQPSLPCISFLEEKKTFAGGPRTHSPLSGMGHLPIINLIFDQEIGFTVTGID